MTTPFTYGFMCTACPYGCETLESAMDHVRNTGHAVSEYHAGAYHLAIERHVDGSTTRIRYRPPKRDSLSSGAST